MAEPFTRREIEKYRADVAESAGRDFKREQHLEESYGTMIREYERWLATVDALSDLLRRAQQAVCDMECGHDPEAGELPVELCADILGAIQKERG